MLRKLLNCGSEGETLKYGGGGGKAIETWW